MKHKILTWFIVKTQHLKKFLSWDVGVLFTLLISKNLINLKHDLKENWEKGYIYSKTNL